jgi:hypothetical protein
MIILGLFDLIDKQRKADKKVDDTVVTEMSYPTGFLPLDYANGVRVTSYDKNDRPFAKQDLIGIVGGTFVSTIGISGTGKSALAIEMSLAGVHKFGDVSGVTHFDLELATTIQRPMTISKIKPSLLKDTYKIYRDRGAEDVVDIFKTHCDVKVQNRKLFTYNTGIRDVFGDEIHELYPSFGLIDSFAMFKSGEVNLDNKGVDGVTNNMQAAQAAKFNKAILSQMLAIGKKANVGIIAVNHINQDVNTGFMPKASQHMYLNQGETMPGGAATLYLANNIIKLKLLKKYQISGKTDGMDYGIPGFLVEAKFIKSRTNAANVPVELVFDQRKGGFSKVLTLFHFAVKNELLLGSNRAHFLPGLESVKFTKKNFKDVVMQSPEILEALYMVCLPYLEAMLSTDTGRMNAVETESEKVDSMFAALEDHQRDIEFYKNQGWTEFLKADRKYHYQRNKYEQTASGIWH